MKCLALLLVASAAQEIRFAEHHKHISSEEAPYEIITGSYKSQPLPLMDGQVVFTKPQATPLEMPSSANGSYAILSFASDITDEDGNAVPLDEVYVHHWIADQLHHKNELCPGLDFVFGIGAEARNTVTKFKTGYGYVVEPQDNFWGGNIHLLHTVNLSTDWLDEAGGDDQAKKQCNECYYAPNKGSKCVLSQNGTFQCCGDNCYDGSCRCPTKPGTSNNTKTFYLSYTITYTYDVASIKPLQAGTIATPNCRTFYEVLRNNEQPEQLSTYTTTAKHDAEIIWAIGHQHTGAINISLFINDVFACASHATYGSTEGVPGDERNHLVQMSVCWDSSVRTTADQTPLVVRKGDDLRIDGWYYVGDDDARLDPGLGGTHLNVMSYMNMYYHLL